MHTATLLDVDRRHGIEHIVDEPKREHAIRVHGVNYHHVGEAPDGSWVYAELPSAGVSHANVVRALRDARTRHAIADEPIVIAKPVVEARRRLWRK